MKLTRIGWLRGAGGQMRQSPVVMVLMAMLLLGAAQVQMAGAQAVSTTTVQGTVYLANGQAGSGTLHLSWPAFTTANGQAVAADSMTVAIAAGWICECEPGSESGRDTGGALLHGCFLHERRDDEHPVLGCAGSGAGEPGAGAVASDAGGAGGSGGEQGLCGPVDRRAESRAS